MLQFYERLKIFLYFLVFLIGFRVQKKCKLKVSYFVTWINFFDLTEKSLFLLISSKKLTLDSLI